MTDFIARLTSRKFLATLGVALVAIGTYLQGSIGAQEMLTAISQAVIAYLVSEGAVDVTRELRR